MRIRWSRASSVARIGISNEFFNFSKPDSKRIRLDGIRYPRYDRTLTYIDTNFHTIGGEVASSASPLHILTVRIHELCARAVPGPATRPVIETISVR